MADLDCSVDESERSQQGKPLKRQDNKICGVCGDRALGYNFNAITCESCKAFFRRNALKNKDFRCPFNDSCLVTSVTRRFCQRCRLKKCFELGMKKEWILSEEDKIKKRRKIALNRARKVQLDPASELDLDDTLPESSAELACSKEPPTVMVADSVCEATAAVLENLAGKARTRGVRTRRRRREDCISAADISTEDGAISEVQHSEATQQILVIPKQEPVELSTSVADGICSITSTDATDLTHAQSSKSLARLYSDRETDYRIVGQSSSSANKRHHSSTEIPSSSVDVFEEEGLVAGLLRSASQSPIEQETNPTRSEPLQDFCSPETEHNQFYTFSPPHEHIKKENNRSDLVDSAVGDYFPEISNFNLEYPTATTTNYGGTVNVLNVSVESVVSPESSTEPESDQFEFSIQEALKMLQPGCRTREPTTYTQSVMDSIVNTAISAEYHAFRMFTAMPKTGELNSVEKMKIHELYEANRGLLAPLCEDSNFKDLPDPSLINVINLTEIAIRRLIKMAKKIVVFKALCQEDQIGLLKAGCTELMILKSVSAYDPDKDSWKIKQDQHSFKNIKLKVLKAAPGNVYEEHKRFILAFKTEWRQDLNIMLLLSAIVLFTPERPFVMHPDAIRHEQSTYLYLLKRYLECKYGSCEGCSHYYKLLERISHLHVLNEDHVRVFLEANPKEMEPLLIEIFDLKQS